MAAEESQSKQRGSEATTSFDQLSASAHRISLVGSLALQHTRSGGSPVFVASTSQKNDPISNLEDTVESTVKQVYHNVHLLKVRILHLLRCPLNENEERRLTGFDFDSVDLKDECKILREQLHDKRQGVATLSAATGSNKSFYGRRDSKHPHVSSSDPIDTSSDPAVILEKAYEDLLAVPCNLVDSFFRHAYEEIFLRCSSQEQILEERLGTRKKLNQAVSMQRDKLDSSIIEKSKLENELAQLKKHNEEIEIKFERHKEQHRGQLDGYLREIAVLKEQIYRAIRDNKYVPKDVDLMVIRDDMTCGPDGCEDVSLDYLLQCRQRVKTVDRQIQLMKERIQRLEEELAEKEQLVLKTTDKQRAQGIALHNIKQEMQQLTDLLLKEQKEKQEVTTLYQQLQAAHEELISIRQRGLDKPVEAEVQASEEEDQFLAAKVSSKEAADLIAQKVLKETLVISLDEYVGKLNTANVTLSNFEKEAARKREELETKAREYQQRAWDAEEKKEEFRKAARIAEVRMDEAERRSKGILESNASQVMLLTRELKVAQDQLIESRSQNASLCQAYVSVSQRLQLLKTRAGLKGYKRRANEFHFQRAETAIHDANQRVTDLNTVCQTIVTTAQVALEESEQRVHFLLEDMAIQKEAHSVELNELRQRVHTVDVASKTLLSDFTRLQMEHLKLVEAPVRKETVDVVGQSSKLNPPPEQRTGSGARRPPSRPLSSAARNSPQANAATLALVELAVQARTEVEGTAKHPRPGSGSVVVEFAKKIRNQCLVFFLAVHDHLITLMERWVAPTGVGVDSEEERISLQEVDSWDSLRKLILVERDARGFLQKMFSLVSENPSLLPKFPSLPTLDQSLESFMQRSSQQPQRRASAASSSAEAPSGVETGSFGKPPRVELSAETEATMESSTEQFLTVSLKLPNKPPEVPVSDTQRHTTKFDVLSKESLEGDLPKTPPPPQLRPIRSPASPHGTGTGSDTPTREAVGLRPPTTGVDSDSLSFGDHRSVSDQLAKLSTRMQQDPTLQPTAIPPWKAYKDRLKAKSSK